MKVLNDKVFIQYEDDTPITEYYKLDDGNKLYIAGEYRPEWHAKCVATVVESGVDGIVKGDKVLVDYRVMFRYKWVGETRVYENEITLPDGTDVFVSDKEFIVAVWKGGKWSAVGYWCIVEECLPEEELINGVIVDSIAKELSNKWVDGIVISTNDSELKSGDRVVFKKSYRCLYKLGIREDIVVVNSSYISAKRLCQSQF